MSISGEVCKPHRKVIINVILFLISVVAVVFTDQGESSSFLPDLAGDIILVSSCYLLLYQFLLHFRREILDVSRKILFILAVILVFVLATRFVSLLPQENIIYIIPFALIPILIRTFYDARLALFIVLMTLMLSGFMVDDSFEFVFINSLAGIAAILSLSDINRRYKLLFSVLLITVTYIIIYYAVKMRQTGSLSSINLSDIKWFIGNGILILLGFPLISVFEKRFYFLSDATMKELCDSGAPLLRRLSEEAPGSYQHSLQVANLAEAASRAIGADVLLARTGSLYHDIGKIRSPEYFIENQVSVSNPHYDLDTVESSKVIISHVENGVLLAKQYKLPVQIIDFIRTHHGTTKVYYFYRKYLGMKKDMNGMENEFVYKGPKPFSREMAIVMMADAVEAASRTVDRYTDDSISELVERAIIFQEQEEQFSDAPLTFREITEIKAVFKKRLSNMYHSRIVYP